MKSNINQEIRVKNIKNIIKRDFFGSKFLFPIFFHLEYTACIPNMSVVYYCKILWDQTSPKLVPNRDKLILRLFEINKNVEFIGAP